MKNKQQKNIVTTDYWKAIRALDESYYSHNPKTFHAVDINLDITVSVIPVGPEISELEKIYELDVESNVVAAALHNNGLTVDDLLMLENDIRSFIPTKYLHPTAKFCLESASWGMEGYDELRITLPTMARHKADDGEIKESTYDILSETILRDVWHRVYPGDGQAQIYSVKSENWNKIKFDYTWLDYEESASPRTVKEFIDKGRAAGHDALGIANDPEAIETLNKIRHGNK